MGERQEEGGRREHEGEQEKGEGEERRAETEYEGRGERVVKGVTCTGQQDTHLRSSRNRR